MELTSDTPPPRLVDSAKDSIDKESSPEGKSSPLRKLLEGEEVRLGLSPGSEGAPVESGRGTKRKRLDLEESFYEGQFPSPFIKVSFRHRL